MNQNQKLLLLASEFLSSEDSSDSDVEYFNTQVRKRANDKNYTSNYIHTIKNYPDDEFKRHFRLKKSTAQHLIDRYCTWKALQGNNETIHYGGKKQVPDEVDVYCFLWFAANKVCIRDVASRFGIGDSTLHVIINRVILFLNEISPEVIKFPNTLQEKQAIAENFEQIAGFPNVLGAIDGTYIPIRTPVNKIKSTYVNRHDIAALTLQAICDSSKQFLDVFTGVSGKIHDSRVLQLSFISQNLNEICENGRFHLIGDSAYPLSSNLLTPYRDYGNLTPLQENYNFKLSKTRVKIENAFGLLKQRFRQLLFTEFWSVKKTSFFIIAVCVLHNLCIKNNDFWEVESDNSEDTVNCNIFHNPLNQKGNEKRDHICQLLPYQ